MKNTWRRTIAFALIVCALLSVMVPSVGAAEPKVVTIDFLLGGGDSVYALKYAKHAEDCGVYMRNVVIEYIKRLSQQGKMVESEIDGRAVVIKAPKK